MVGLRDIFFRNKGPKGRQSRPEYQDRKVQPRLPTSRPRALTLPPFGAPDSFTDATKQWTSSQAASQLMRLPLELRLQIYEAVLGNHKAHIAFEFGSRKYRTFKKNEVLEWRWWHTICTRDQIEDGRNRNVWEDQCITGKVDGKPGPPNGMMGKMKLDFALLLSCRQVYSEAVNILYSTTTFDFASCELLHSFTSLVLPHRFAAITSIEQVWTFVNFSLFEIPIADKKFYNDMWRILASMPNLRQVRIAIATYRCPDPVPENLQEIWLQPLEQFRGKNMDIFEILVPESYAANLHVNETSHFKLIAIQDIDLFVCHMGTL